MNGSNEKCARISMLICTPSPRTPMQPVHGRIIFFPGESVVAHSVQKQGGSILM